MPCCPSGRDSPASHASRSPILLAALLAVGNPAGADGTPAVLEFESQPDGRCQILSEGGRLVSMHNRRTDRAVNYRLVRYFAEHPQNRVVGEIPAASIQPLGCDTVDGRPQHWVVERFQIEEE
jgi:hypothetical protein